MIIHSIDMNFLATATMNNHMNNQGMIEELRRKMEKELPDQNFTTF